MCHFVYANNVRSIPRIQLAVSGGDILETSGSTCVTRSGADRSAGEWNVAQSGALFNENTKICTTCAVDATAVTVIVAVV